jgi:ferredoxin
MPAPRLRSTPLPAIDPDRCRACGACVRSCPHGVLILDAGPVRLARPSRCDYCGLCEAACPSAAITCPYEIVLAPVAGRR